MWRFSYQSHGVRKAQNIKMKNICLIVWKSNEGEEGLVIVVAMTIRDVHIPSDDYSAAMGIVLFQMGGVPSSGTYCYIMGVECGRIFTGGGVLSYA